MLDLSGDIRQAYLTMIISSDSAPVFRQEGVTAVGYASPSRGATDLSLWRLSLAPGEASPPHSLSREEVFLALGGSAVATIDGAEHPFADGDCLVVPTGVPFISPPATTASTRCARWPPGDRRRCSPTARPSRRPGPPRAS